MYTHSLIYKINPFYKTFITDISEIHKELEKDYMKYNSLASNIPQNTHHIRVYNEDSSLVQGWNRIIGKEIMDILDYNL